MDHNYTDKYQKMGDTVGSSSSDSITEENPAINNEQDELLIESEDHSPEAVCRRDLQKRLKFLFMNPCDKVRAKRRFPWKLFLQIVKVGLVTLQLAFFGLSRSGHVDFLEKSNLALRHLYLQGWEASYETLPYPPATGIYAIYTIPEFYDHVNYAMKRYDQTQKLAIGTYHFSSKNHTHQPKMWMCKEFYREGKINASAQSYKFDATHVTDCFKLDTVKECDKTGNCTQKYDVEKFLQMHNKSINFDRIIKIDLNFTVKTVHLKELSQMSSPDCFEFGVKITFGNQEHNGQMAISLSLQEVPLTCNGHIIHDAPAEDAMLASAILLDLIVIIVSVVSFILCFRSIYRARMLKRETESYFWQQKRKKLSRRDRLEFLNMWYILILFNDALAFAGSIVKILIETKYSHSYEGCGLMLGAANLLVWFGVLRYFGFFADYNILLLTLKKAFPIVMRFLVVAAVFYFGFAVCGWVVLGPYHLKFRSLSASSECLFSLVNGDDMFVTFSVIGENAPVYIWWFSRIYLYVFISLFIYGVLNLFIAVILDSYEILKKWREKGHPKTALHKFIDECPDYSDMVMSHRHKQTCKGNLFCCCEVFCHCNSCKGEDSEVSEDEYIDEPLIDA